MKPSFSGMMFKRLARRAGIRVHLEPGYGIVGQVRFPGNKKKYFRGARFDLNRLGSSIVAGDKDYANYFMKKMGYPTALGKAFYGDRWGRNGRDIRAAYKYAKQIGFPVFVKPNNLSQGEGVAKVFTKAEFYRAVRFILKRDEVFLVQRALLGKDYRLLVLDGEMVSAYERFPFSVEGNGKSTLRDLVRKKIKKLFRERTDVQARIDDPRIISSIRRAGISWNSILSKGRRVYLLHNANLSTGGDAIDVSKLVHSAFRRIAVRVTRDMGLRYCGVDLMVKGDISRSPRKYWILELNAAPGVEYYASSGSENRRRVERIYLRILKAMERSRS